MCKDIREQGLREPIVLLDGQILDGGNRYRACQQVGVDPHFVEFEGDDPAAYVLSKNLRRRHLVPGQHAAFVAAATNWAEAHGHGGDRGNQHGGPRQVATLPLGSIADRSAASGASERTQRMADKVAKADPDLALKVAHGEVSLPKAVKEVEAKAPPKPAKPVPETTVAPQEAILGNSQDATPPPGESDDDDAFGESDPLQMLEDAQREIETMHALLKAAEADDLKAEAMKWRRAYDHSQRQQSDAMLSRGEGEYTSSDGAEFTDDASASAQRNIGVLDRAIAAHLGLPAGDGNSVHPYVARGVSEVSPLGQVAAAFGQRVQWFDLAQELTPQQRRTNWVVTRNAGDGRGQEHLGYFDSEQDANEAAERFRTTPERSRGGTSRWWPQSGAESLRSVGVGRLDSVGRQAAARRTLEARSGSIKSFDEGLSLTQILALPIGNSMEAAVSSSRQMEAESAVRVSFGLSPVPDEKETAREALRLNVLRQRAERLRERLCSVPFHAKKAAKAREAGDELAYWIDLVPQRVDLPPES